MPALAQRLRLVDRLAPGVAASILAESLAAAQPDECSPIVAALLERPCEAVFAAVVRRWGDLDEATRSRVAQTAARLPAIMSACARSADLHERRCAIELIGVAAVARCADSLAESLDEEDADLAAAAAAALDRLAAATPRSIEPGSRDRLDEALARALDTWPKHRQHGVLVAAARMLADPGPALGRWLDDRDHPTHLAMRGFMKRLPDATLAPLLLGWLGIDALAGQALEHIERLAPTPHFAAIIAGREHLLLRPEQSARLGRLDPRRPAAPPCHVVAQLDDEAQAALPAWLTAIPMTLEERLVRLGEGVTFRTPRARLAALRALIGLDEARADEFVARFTADEDERLASLAAHHCLRRRFAGLEAMLERLLTSSHPSLRALAAVHAHAADFETLWSHWSGRGPVDSIRLAARVAVRDNRASILADVRRRLRDSRRDTALRAVRMAEDLDLLPEVELELLALAASDDPRLAATAVKALGRVESETARDAVLAAIGHHDVRTRANAIEVLASPLIERHRPMIETLTQAPENRPRANAIAALARVDRGAAAERLDAMLDDERPLHRLSALWAAEQTAMIDCATRVAHLAQRDPSGPIRDRARRTARRLLAAMTHHAPVSRSADALHAAAAPTAHSVAPAEPAASSAARPSISMLSIAPLTLGAWPGWSWEWMAPSLAALAVVGATVAALRWSLNDAARLGPAYRTVSRGLGLTWRERRLLHAIAVRAGRPHASGMLISRGTFDHHVATWRQQSGDGDEAARERLAALRARLFD